MSKTTTTKRKASEPPRYLRHVDRKGRERAIVRIQKDRSTVYLGDYNRPASRRAYLKVLDAIGRVRTSSAATSTMATAPTPRGEPRHPRQRPTR